MNLVLCIPHCVLQKLLKMIHLQDIEVLQRYSNWILFKTGVYPFFHMRQTLQIAPFYHPVNKNQSLSPSISFSSPGCSFFFAAVKKSLWPLLKDSLKKPLLAPNVPNISQIQRPWLSRTLASRRPLPINFSRTPLDLLMASVCINSSIHKPQNFTAWFAYALSHFHNLQ